MAEVDLVFTPTREKLAGCVGRAAALRAHLLQRPLGTRHRQPAHALDALDAEPGWPLVCITEPFFAEWIRRNP